MVELVSESLEANSQQNANAPKTEQGIDVSIYHVGMVFLVTMAVHAMVTYVNVFMKTESQNIMVRAVICLLLAMEIHVKMVVYAPKKLKLIILRVASK